MRLGLAIAVILAGWTGARTQAAEYASGSRLALSPGIIAPVLDLKAPTPPPLDQAATEPPTQARLISSIKRGVQEISIEFTRLNGRPIAKKESFGVEVPTGGHPELFKGLFSNFGLMFLIAPHMPESVAVDFSVSPQITEFIGEMYRSSGRKPPRIDAPTALEFPRLAAKAQPGARSIVAYSAGKDSVYNYVREIDAKGARNVKILHYGLLNPAVGAAELAATRKQIERFPIPQAQIVNVHNSTRNRGHAIMQAREFLMLAMAVPVALDFGASEILTEGSYDDHDPYFGGKLSAYLKFNALMKSLGIPVSSRWIEIPQMDVLNYVLERKPRWLKQVRNCFSPGCWSEGYRRAWRKHAPKLAALILKATDGNCGSCLKCRITNLAVLLQNPSRLKTLPKAELGYFVANMKKWAEAHREQHGDFLDDKFWQAMRRLEERLR